MVVNVEVIDLTPIIMGMSHCLQHHWCPEVRAACVHGFSRLLRDSSSSSAKEYKNTSHEQTYSLLLQTLLPTMKKETHVPTFSAQLSLLLLLLKREKMISHLASIWSMLQHHGLQSEDGLCASPDAMSCAIRVIGHGIGTTTSTTLNTTDILDTADTTDTAGTTDTTDTAVRSDMRRWFLALVEGGAHTTPSADVEVRHAMADALSSSNILLTSVINGSWIACWDALFRLMQDDDVRVRIAARNAVCVSMGRSDMSVASKCLRDAYQHVLTVCSRTNDGSLVLYKYVVHRFVEMHREWLRRESMKDKMMAASLRTKKGSTREDLKVFDDERVNFFIEEALEVELLHRMLRQLRHPRHADGPGGRTQCGSKNVDVDFDWSSSLARVMAGVELSKNQLMYYADEHRFRGVYGTLLFFDGMCCVSMVVRDVMRKTFPSGLEVPSSVPRSIARALRRLNVLLTSAAVLEEEYSSDGSIFRLEEEY